MICSSCISSHPVKEYLPDTKISLPIFFLENMTFPDKTLSVLTLAVVVPMMYALMRLTFFHYDKPRLQTWGPITSLRQTISSSVPCLLLAFPPKSGYLSTIDPGAFQFAFPGHNTCSLDMAANWIDDVLTSGYFKFLVV